MSDIQDPQPQLTEQRRGPGRPSKPRSTIQELVASDEFKQKVALALPKHTTPDRFIRVALNAMLRTPKLMQCSQASLMKALLDLSTFGLEPDGRRAHLIPFGDEVQLIIDYKGLVELIRRSGDVSYIHADVVCENDYFEYQFGTDAKLVHKPKLNNRGKVYCAYSFIRLKDGSEDYDVMGLDEIDAIKARSKAVQHKKMESPWFTDENEMRKKTVFRRHSKWQRWSPEVQGAIEYDDERTEIPARGIVIERPVLNEPKQDLSFLTPSDDDTTQPTDPTDQIP